MDKEIAFLLGTAIVIIIFMLNIRNLYPVIFLSMLTLVPLSHMSVMPRSVLGVSGLNVVNVVWLLLFLFTIGILIIRRERLYFVEYLSGPILILLALYFVAAFRTIVDLQALEGATSIMPARKLPLSLSGRILEDFIKPLQIVLIGWMVLVACHLKGRELVGNALIVTVLVLGVIAIFVFFKGALELGAFEQARLEISRKLGMHANMLGRIALALLISILFFNGKMSPIWRIMSIFTALLIIGISMSRACYVVMMIALFLYYKDIQKKERKILLGIVGLVAVMLSGVIVERILHGLDVGKGEVDVNTVSASRVDKIWAPLLPTIKENLLVGLGLHGIRKSGAAKRGEILSLSPHSSYVQLILDSGLVGVIMFLGAMYTILKQAKRYKSEIYYMIIPIIILGITDPTFYPKYTFYYFFVLYGLYRYDVVKESRMSSASVRQESV